MSHSGNVTRAAHNVLVRSLGLRQDQNLLVFADSASLQVAETVSGVAHELGIAVSVIYVPRLLQSAIQPHESLPLPVESAMREVDAILSCLSDRPEHFPYRLRVLRTGWSRRTKLAHAPGMTLNVLRAADTDYVLIGDNGRLLALAFTLGRQLTVLSCDSQGHEYRLDAEISGWDYPPGIDDGVIQEGAWSNLPPGETFVVPNTANGRLAVNGALPGKVLAPGSEVILTFRNGSLRSMEPEEGPAARFLSETQISHARRMDDPHWCNLAEIGIGLNPAIDRLTGVQLLDTKKANTLHVALGHSASLGGDVESAIKCDLVVESPTVFIDGKPVLEAGQWRVRETDWRLDHRRASPPNGWWESLGTVCRSGRRAERDHDRLVCQWNPGPGRRDVAPVGAEQTARQAALLYDLLPEWRERVSAAELLSRASAAGLEPETIPGLLWVMHRFDLVRSGADRAA